MEFTALHFAAIWGHLEVVKLLVDKGAAISPKNEVSARDSRAPPREPLTLDARAGWRHASQNCAQREQ